jgi:hypothetical protein
MRLSTDRGADHDDPAMTNEGSRTPPVAGATDRHQIPDRITELVTCMIDLLTELYTQPADGAPTTASDDPALRAAIRRLQRLEDSLRSLSGQDTSVGPGPRRARSDSCDRGEWVEAGR